MKPKAVRVVVADDAPEMRDLLAFAIRLQSGMEIVGEARSLSQSPALIARKHPDVALLSASGEPYAAVAAAAAIRDQDPDTGIVIVADDVDGATVRAAMACGADEIIGRKVPLTDVFAAIRRAGNREPGEQIA